MPAHVSEKHVLLRLFSRCVPLSHSIAIYPVSCSFAGRSCHALFGEYQAVAENGSDKLAFISPSLVGNGKGGRGR